MAVKSFEVNQVGTVKVYKHKGAKSVRLSITTDGKVKVTVPFWASYTSGLDFVHSKAAWIAQNLPVKPEVLRHGLKVGKAHRLTVVRDSGTTIRTRLAGSEIRILLPQTVSIGSAAVQKAAHTACLRALRKESEKLLPVRLHQLADRYGFTYSSVHIKQLTGRWGSCNTHRQITLNLFLMQLPWHLIDYVLLHELTHTKHLDHSERFWKEFLTHEPRAKQYRQQIKTYKPILQTAYTA